MKLLLLFLLSVVRGSRYYCYKGSSLYQIEYVDCGDLNGQSEWYCSKVTVSNFDFSFFVRSFIIKKIINF